MRDAGKPVIRTWQDRGEDIERAYAAYVAAYEDLIEAAFTHYVAVCGTRGSVDDGPAWIKALMVMGLAEGQALDLWYVLRGAGGRLPLKHAAMGRGEPACPSSTPRWGGENRHAHHYVCRAK